MKNCNAQHSFRRPATLRRGAILFLVLITGTVIAVISLGGLIIQTTQFHAGRMSGDALEARVASRSAIAVGTQRVVADPTWRSSRPPGEWYTDAALQDGTWTLSATDPVDANFPNNQTDPLQLTATAGFGEAVQRSQATLQADAFLHDSLRFAAVAQKDITFDSATVESAAWLRAGDRLSASGSSVIRADVSAVNDISGSGYQHRTHLGGQFAALPVYSDFATIAAAGTTVTPGSLLMTMTSNANLLRNQQFNQGDLAWATTGTASLTTFGFGGFAGSPCVVVGSRTAATDGVTADITSGIRSGRQLMVDGYVLPLVAEADVRVSIIVQTDTSTTEVASWTSPKLAAGVFGVSSPSYFSGTLTPSWSGRLKSATIKFRTHGSGAAGTQDFAIDNLSCRIASTPSGNVVYREIVSAGSNPFGVSNNADGIYVMNCGGQDVTITDSVIVGTMFFSNAGKVTVGPGPVHWRPARPGLPAIVVDGELILSASRQSVSEYELTRNFNPPGTPDLSGSTNFQLDDRYPSEIRGLVYSVDRMTVTGDVRIRGTLVTADDLEFHQRATLHPAPEYLTVQQRPIWTFGHLVRPTHGVRRLFD